MISSNITTNSSLVTVRAKVELYNGSTLIQTCTCGDYLSEFKVDRAGEDNKFFGFGICHKLEATLIDLENKLTVEKGYIVKIGYSTNDSAFTYPYPDLYITDVSKEDTQGTIHITAYDALYQAAEIQIADDEDLLTLTEHRPLFYAAAIASRLVNGSAMFIGGSAPFSIDYAGVVNFDGTETLRAVLNAIAEVTQTIYYISNENKLVFKKLSKDSTDVVLTIPKADYINLTFDEARTLTNICSATELGNNMEVSTGTKDATQYIRDNPFWELLGTDEDTSTLDFETILNDALTRVGGLTITPFTCEWFGNYFLEPGDKITIAADEGSISTYLLSDILSYNGVITETSTWQYSNDEAETFSNPTSLGEFVKQTYAKVDKANKQIDLVTSESDANTKAIAALQINTESISGSVKTIQETTSAQFEELEGEVGGVKTDLANFVITSEEALLEFKTEIEENGVTKVSGKGYSFSEEGFKINAEGSAIETTITEDGMSISREGEEVLRADNQGVKAEDLHATTWLIIGETSRLEDYTNADGKKRTGCFWIGG